MRAVQKVMILSTEIIILRNEMATQQKMCAGRIGL
jgi:hypothetical protein